MHAAGVERVPAEPARAAAISLAIKLHLVVDDVVLARHVVHVELCLRNDLLGIVEFGRLREMRDVAGVDHEGWLRRHCLDLADGLFERAIDVRVRGLVESHVAVADLQEGERTCALRHRLVDKPERARYAASDCPEDAGPRPGHAFENFAAVNAIVIRLIGAHFYLHEASLLHETRSAEPQIYSRKNRLLAKARSSERFAPETTMKIPRRSQGLAPENAPCLVWMVSGHKHSTDVALLRRAKRYPVHRCPR